MQHPKYLYITGIITGAIGGIIASLAAYAMSVYIFTGNSMASLSVIAMAVGVLVGSAVAFIVYETSKTLNRKNIKN